MNIQNRRTKAWGIAAAGVVLLVLTGWAAGQSPAVLPPQGGPTADGEGLVAPATAPEPPAEKSPKAATKPAATPDTETVVKMSRPGAFEIHFRDAAMREAFEMLGSQGHKNIVATKEVTGKVNADLYDVTFKEALEAILGSTGYAYQEQGNFIYVMTQEQFQKKIEAQRKLSVRTYRLFYVTANDAKTLIAPAMSKDGTIAVTPAAIGGIATSGTDAGGNNYATEDLLIVRDYDENLDHVDEIVHKIDVKPQQVLIEATILRATLTENTALGIDFNTLAGVDFTALTATTNGLTNVTTPTVDVTKGITPSGTFRTDFNGSVPSGGASFGFISNNISVFLRAVESITDTTILANPKLLVINKQRGEVMVGNKDGYLTTTVTETVATQTVQFLETGTRLIVRPFIGKDGYVRMEIHPEDSSGSVSVVGTSVLPNETTTEVTSNVLVRDGHTIVIGGLFREKTGSNRSQVPAVGNIPFLGAAFRYTADSTTRDEVIILITPHIVQQAADEAASEQIKDDTERIRVGARKGLQWFGRSPLANAYVQQAKDDMAKGKIDLALFNLDMALSVQPRLLEAIRLKERLTQKAYWADENQVSTTKFVIDHMIMQELGKPTSEIIPPGKPLHASDIDPKVREAFGIEKEYEAPLPIGDLLKNVKKRVVANKDTVWTDSPASPTSQPTKTTIPPAPPAKPGK